MGWVWSKKLEKIWLFAQVFTNDSGFIEFGGFLDLSDIKNGMGCIDVGLRLGIIGFNFTAAWDKKFLEDINKLEGA